MALSEIFQEEYVVRFDYKDQNGYTIRNCEETVFVDVKHGINEKRNHDLAREIILKKYNKRGIQIQIHNIVYC